MSILVAASATLANAETFTGTPNNQSGNSDSAITGFYFTVGQLSWQPEISGMSQITLSALKFESSRGNNGATKYYSGDLYAFIYEGTGTDVTTAASNTLIGHSTNSITWTSSSASNSGTWEFSNLSLDVSKTYSVLFSSSKDTFTSAKGSSGSGEGIRTEIFTTAGTGLKAYNYNGSNTQNYGVNITLTAVPEPSMFGVLAGLGALALVGARRRRK